MYVIITNVRYTVVDVLRLQRPLMAQNLVI